MLESWVRNNEGLTYDSSSSSGNGGMDLINNIGRKFVEIRD